MGIRRLAAAVFILGGCVSACGGTPHSRAVLPPPSASPVRAPVVMLLGDSYTTGGREVPPERTYAGDAARDLGWQVIIGGLGGTGFVAPGATHEPFEVLFDRQFSWRPAPDMVILSGGHNDRRYGPARVATAAAALVARIRRLWPGTRVLIIGPMWGSGAPDAAALEIRDALAVTARAQGVPFIDPLAAKWITGDRKTKAGNARDYIKPDGVHPTPTGHRYLATRLVTELRRLGLAKL